MECKKRKMHLIGWLGTGPTTYHLGAWRYPTSENHLGDPEGILRTAQALERAKFDAVFFADSVGNMRDRGSLSRGGVIRLIDPVPLASWLAQGTSKIGIGVTVSSSFIPPYAIARLLGSVDYLSGGRIGWNVVTSGDSGVREMGFDNALPKKDRYRRAAEVVSVCQRLWRSFPQEAVVVDRSEGLYIDTEQLDYFDYEGEYVKTTGPLAVPISDQGGPVIIQAGGSDEGRDFAAAYADVIFVMANSPEAIRNYIEDIRQRVSDAGRDPESARVFAAVNVVVAETESIAQERWALVNELVNSEAALSMASSAARVDLAAYDENTPASSIDFPEGGESDGGIRQLLYQVLEATPNLTVKEVSVRLTNSAIPTLVGNPSQVADQLQSIFEESSAAGFMIAAPIMPGSFEDFARLVVPILQERNLYRTEYPGSTLRDSLESKT